jgi:hypothetical protein
MIGFVHGQKLFFIEPPRRQVREGIRRSLREFLHNLYIIREFEQKCYCI